MVEIIFQGKPVAKGKVEYPPNGKNGKQKRPPERVAFIQAGYQNTSTLIC